MFLIKNDHSRNHHVSVNPFNFERRQGTDPDSRGEPVHVFVKFYDDVPGDGGAFVLRVRDREAFGGEPSGRVFKYKYTIEASELPDKDPDIDINN